VYRQEIGEKMGETEGNFGERERKKRTKREPSGSETLKEEEDYLVVYLFLSLRFSVRSI
jgi:hypothetical protein